MNLRLSSLKYRIVRRNMEKIVNKTTESGHIRIQIVELRHGDFVACIVAQI